MGWLSRFFGWLSRLFGRGKKKEAAVKMAKDPVCGMDVEPAKAAAKSEYKGQTYYFCAPGCKTTFDKEPEKYLAGHRMKM